MTEHIRHEACGNSNMKSGKNRNESDRSAIDLAIELTAASADLASQINKYGKSAGSDLSKDQAFLVSQAAQQIQAVLTELIGAIDPCVSRKTVGTTPIENREVPELEARVPVPGQLGEALVAAKTRPGAAIARAVIRYAIDVDPMRNRQ